MCKPVFGKVALTLPRHGDFRHCDFFAGVPGTGMVPCEKQSVHIMMMILESCTSRLELLLV